MARAFSLPPEFSSWPEERQVEYCALLELHFGGEGLDEFIRRILPQFPPPAHLAPLRAVIERSRHGEVRCCISLPRRHGKTMTLGPGLAWLINREPACLNAFCGYGDTFVSEWSRKVRDWSQQGGAALATDAQSVNLWRTREGGGLIASGVGGPLTGFGITGLLVVDDPIKNPVEAESQLMRDRTWDWFARVAYPTVEPRGSIIVCATRWHQDDLIGRLKNGDLGEWEILEYPAVRDEHGNAADERIQSNVHALWPEVYPLSELAKRRQAGEYGWWSLYQQQPRPRGGQIFAEPGRFDLRAFDPRGKRFVVGVDPAATEKTKGDYSAVVTMGIDHLGQCYVLDVQRWKVGVPRLVERLRAMASICKHADGAPLVIEAIGGFKAVPQMLSHLDPSLQISEIIPVKDKFLRAQPLSAAWNQGRVLVPSSAQWLSEFMREVMSFTGSEDVHDDQVDAMVHAFDYLQGHSLSVDDWGNGTMSARAFTSTTVSAWDD